MNTNNNAAVMIIAWLGYLGVVVYLAATLDAVAIPFAAIMMVPLIVMMNMLYKQDQRKGKSEMSSSQEEKRKRQRIDNMIRDMSDQELWELRQRLQDGTVDEGVLYDRVVGDDGELMRR